MENLNILIVGVGGQGTLLASKFLGAAASLMGKDVKVSEVHGMSQRGGSVVTCVKMGDRVASPIIDLGEADVILSFEAVESLRWLPYMKPAGTVITNTQEINPMPVVSGQAVYPEDVLGKMEKDGISMVAFDALSVAESCGTVKCVNIVLLGVLAALLPEIGEEIWKQALESVVPAKLLAVNEKAFQEGLALGKKKGETL